MIVFISGAISNDPNYKSKFDAAEKQLTEQGYIVLNPTILPVTLDYEKLMSICFKMIDVADAVYFMDGWKRSPGARREFSHAYGQNKIYNEDCCNLAQYQALCSLILDKQRESDRLLALCEKSTTTLSGMPGGGESSKEDMNIKRIELDDEIKPLIYQRTCLRSKIMNSFSLLCDDEMIDVMTCKYIFFMSERAIAKKLDKSQFYIRQLHDKALEKLFIDVDRQSVL